MLRAQCHEKQGEWKEALSVLQGAFNLPGVSKTAPAGAAGRGKAKAPTPEERAQIFIHLAMVHNELGQTPEATKIIVEAKREFHGTPAHAQIIIVDADLALKRGDVHAALKLLQGVGPDSPHYIKARVAAANIHLTHRHDKKNFIRYFVELKEKNKDSVAMHCMLAEAYMRLQEPDQAVLAYQEARKLEERQTGERGDSGTRAAAPRPTPYTRSLNPSTLNPAPRTRSGSGAQGGGCPYPLCLDGALCSCVPRVATSHVTPHPLYL